jgi:hypothetical protein
MQIDQAIRRLWQGVKRRLANLSASIKRARMPNLRAPKIEGLNPGAAIGNLGGRLGGWIGERFASLGLGSKLGIFGAAIAFLVLYYVVGAFLMSKIDADTGFAPPATETPAASSQSVAIAAALLDREMPRWVPNDPVYKPSVVLHNMPNFQRGMLKAFQRFTIELNDQLGRTRGSSPIDPDLEKAAGDIRYPADRWIWNADRWWAISLTTEDSYRRAAKELKAYNRRLAANQATFDPRADNLRATLDGFANDLGATSAAIDEFVTKNAGFPLNYAAAHLFYRAKGQMYACYMILKGLKADTSAVLKERNVEAIYDQMLKAFEQGVELSPFLVLNGTRDGSLFPNHLVIIGFSLLQARTRLREITSVLQN